jgi:hypothetical protein
LLAEFFDQPKVVIFEEKNFGHAFPALQ